MVSKADFDILQVIVLLNDIGCLIGIYRYSRDIKIKHHFLSFFYYLNSAVMSVRGLLAAIFLLPAVNGSNISSLLLPIVGIPFIFAVAALLLMYAVSDKYKFMKPI